MKKVVVFASLMYVADIFGTDVDHKSSFCSFFSKIEHSVKKKVKKHFSRVNKRNKNGETKLSFAVRSGSKEAVENLIDRGANVNLENKDGNCPLHVAIELGNMEMVKYLVENGADVNKKGIRDNSPLDFSRIFRYKEIKNYLIRHGAGIDKDGRVEDNSLWFDAVDSKELDLVKSLVEFGVDIGEEGALGTPLSLCVRFGTDEMTEYLIKQMGDRKENLINHIGRDNETALSLAVEGGLVQKVAILIENGADIGIDGNDTLEAESDDAELSAFDRALRLINGTHEEQDKASILSDETSVDAMSYIEDTSFLNNISFSTSLYTNDTSFLRDVSFDPNWWRDPSFMSGINRSNSDITLAASDNQ
jgi:ankyrin repeat protein